LNIKRKGDGNMKGLTLILILGLFLYATNPTIEDYNSWLESKLKSQTTNFLEDVVVSVGFDTMKDYVTTREDLLLFSIYTSNLGNGEFEVIGIGKQFIVIP
jgi:secreted trypsin-like serine protease